MIYNKSRGGVLLPDQEIKPAGTCDMTMFPMMHGVLGGAADNAAVLNAVHFDGTNDWMTYLVAMTGEADAKLGIFSMWFKLDATSTGVREHFWSSTRIGAEKQADDTVRIFGANSGASTKLDMRSTGTTLTTAWTHILGSWDLGNSIIDLYLNDTNVTTETTNLDDDLDYTTGTYYIGQETTEAGQIVHGDVAQLYFNQAEFLNFNTESNRRKFITAGGKPMDLESDGSGPTGTAPIVFHDGETATWHTNKGSGGGFTEVGALTDAATSPSD